MLKSGKRPLTVDETKLSRNDIDIGMRDKVAEDHLVLRNLNYLIQKGLSDTWREAYCGSRTEA